MSLGLAIEGKGPITSQGAWRTSHQYDQLVHLLMAAELSFNTQHTARKCTATGPPAPSLLANQAGVFIAWLNFSFQ